MKNKIITAFAAAAMVAIPALAQTATPAPAQPNAATAVTKAPRATVTGMITAVDPNLKMVTIKDATGISFNLKVRSNTRIMAGKQHLTLQDLAADVNKNATATFLQRARGDVARAIHLQG